MVSPSARELNWLDTFDKELTLNPARGLGFESDFLRSRKRKKLFGENFDMCAS